MFFTDLDRTIIFSNRFVNDQNREGLIPVEEKEGRLISFMNPAALQHLQTIRQQIPFIPVTARKFDEIMRINFIKEEMPEWMICESGRVIYHFGKRLREWDHTLENHLAPVSSLIKEAHEKFTFLLEETYQVRSWHINESMVMGRTDEMSQEQIEDLASYTNWFSEKGCHLHLQQRKAYVIPVLISKENAVSFLMETLTPSLTFSAGDADMDAGMLGKTSYSAAPVHHTIAQLPSHTQVTEGFGLDAGEEILLSVMDTFHLFKQAPAKTI